MKKIKIYTIVITITIILYGFLSMQSIYAINNNVFENEIDCQEYNSTINDENFSYFDNEIFSSAVCIDIVEGEVKLNGETIDSKTVVSYIGSYELTLTNDGVTHSINFTIVPVFDGVDNNTTTTAIDLTITGKVENPLDFTLNGETYDYLNETNRLEEAGKYTFKYKGPGDYTGTFEFTIDSFITGVKDNDTFDTYIDFETNYKEVKLNDIVIDSFENVGVAGDNTLTFYDVEGELTEIITFTIEPEYNVLLEELEIDGELPLEITAGEVTLNTIDVSKDTIITRPGIYTVVIKGHNYEKTFKFELNPVIENIENDKEYFGEVTPVINSGDLTLNGDSYTSGETIRLIGHQKLTIDGENGYKKTIDFTIHPKFEGINNNATTEAAIDLTITGEVVHPLDFTLNVETYDYLNETNRLEEAGKYTFEYKGLGDYQGRFEFTISGYLEGVDSDSYTATLQINTNYPLITINGYEVTDFDDVGVAGHNYLYAYDLQGLQQEYKYFYITPQYNNKLDEDIYEGAFPLEITAGEVKLNGEPISRDHILREPGFHHIIISGQNYVDKDFNIQIVPIIENITHNAVYHGPITPEISGGTKTLNDDPYTSGDLIDTIGNHVLLIKGESRAGYADYHNKIEFTIHPTFIGIEENESTLSVVDLEIIAGKDNEQDFTLNGIPFNDFNQSLKFEFADKYLFKYSGPGDYQGRFEFTIDSFITGVKDNDTFDTYIDFETNYKEVKLNDIVIDSFENVGVAGDNTLTFYDVEGNLKETIEFTIQPKTNHNLKDGYFEGELALEISAGEVTLDGISVSRNHVIKEPGNYKLVISEGDFSESFIFTVKPIIQNIANKEIYFGEVTPKISSGKLTLNGDPYTSGEPVNMVGEYEIKIEGHGGFSKTVEFTIHPTITGNLGRIFNNDNIDEYMELDIEGDFREEFEVRLNDQLVGITDRFVIDQFGEYVFEFRNNDNYEYTVKFEVEPNLGKISDNKQFILNLETEVFGGDIYINDEFYDCEGSESKSCALNLNEVGNYTLEIFGLSDKPKTYSFSIDPFIEVDGESFLDLNTEYNTDKRTSLNIEGEIESLYLNGESVDYEEIKNFKLDYIGFYTVLVNGINGYTKEFLITVDAPDVNGYIQNNKTYYDSVELFTQSEDETLPKVSESNINVAYITYSAIMVQDETESQVADVNGEDLYSEILSTRNFENIGKYRVELIGEGGFVQTLYFVIEPFKFTQDLGKMIEEMNYIEFDEVHPKTQIIMYSIDNGELKVEFTYDDADSANNSYDFGRFGNHHISIINSTDEHYKVDYKYTIEVSKTDFITEGTNGIKRFNSNSDVVKWEINDRTQIHSSKNIDKHGENIVIVHGLNDYRVEFVVEYKNPYRGFLIDNIHVFGSIIAFSGLLLLTRRGVKHD